MAKFFNNIKESNKEGVITSKLANAAVETNKSIKSNDLFPLFNTHEKEIIEEIGKIVEHADEYTEK
jgi:hypothetical protein